MQIKVIASGSAGNCYLIKNDDTALLIECGIPFKRIQKSLKFDLRLKGCLLTHSHKDHSLSAKNVCERAINLYTTMGTYEELGFNHHRVKTFKKSAEEYEPVEMGSFKIIPFATEHDTKEPVGFYIVDLTNKETLLFATDTAFIKYTFPKITHMMIECNYIKSTIDNNVLEHRLDVNLRNRIVKTHMSLETLLDYLKCVDMEYLQDIYILHLSDNNSDEKEIKSKVQEATGKPIIIC